jgi:hypothetical protein
MRIIFYLNIFAEIEMKIKKKMKIEELFQLLKSDEVGDFKAPSSLKVKTPDGFRKVEALKKTLKNPEWKIITESGREAVFTDFHQLEVTEKFNGKCRNDCGRIWAYMVDIKPGNFVVTEEGLEEVKSIESLNKMTNMYDLQVEGNKCYFANGFVSHNTLVMGNMGLNAFIGGHNPLFISAETSVTRLYQRIFSNVLEMEKKEILMLEKEEFGELLKRRLESIPSDFVIKQVLANNYCGNDITAYVSDLINYKGFKPSIIFADYIGILAPNDKKISPENSFLYFKRVAEDLRNVSIKLNIPVVTANQINREGMDEKGGSKAFLSGKSVAGSRGVYDTADCFFPIAQTAKDKEKSKIYMLGDKSRNNQTGWRIEYDISYPLMKMEERGIIN